MVVSCRLQTDTSLALEAKIMQRWEFDSIEQAASCISLWFLGTPTEQLHLKEYLEPGKGNFLLLSSPLEEESNCL